MNLFKFTNKKPPKEKILTVLKSANYGLEGYSNIQSIAMAYAVLACSIDFVHDKKMVVLRDVKYIENKFLSVFELSSKNAIISSSNIINTDKLVQVGENGILTHIFYFLKQFIPEERKKELLLNLFDIDLFKDTTLNSLIKAEYWPSDKAITRYHLIKGDTIEFIDSLDLSKVFNIGGASGENPLVVDNKAGVYMALLDLLLDEIGAYDIFDYTYKINTPKFVLKEPQNQEKVNAPF